jgi:FixJ family two-component response regulator
MSGPEFQTKCQIDIPIISITGHGDIAMSVKAIRAGAADFLTKPFREQEIFDAVWTALGRDRTHKQRIHNLHSRFGTLSQREQEVMTLVVTGLMNKQAAAELRIA